MIVTLDAASSFPLLAVREPTFPRSFPITISECSMMSRDYLSLSLSLPAFYCTNTRLLN